MHYTYQYHRQELGKAAFTYQGTCTGTVNTKERWALLDLLQYW